MHTLARQYYLPILLCMSATACLICNRPVGRDPRAKYCSKKHKWAHWSSQAKARAAQAEQLPIATLPDDPELQLPNGPEREPAILRLLLRLYAPAGALGYRLGRRHGPRQLMRWFPIKRAGPLPLYLLEPFQIPLVPVAGIYVVTYLDRALNPIGGPRFRIDIQTVNTWLPLTMGDRSYRLKKGRGA